MTKAVQERSRRIGVLRSKGKTRQEMVEWWNQDLRTIAGKIPEIEPCGRNLTHGWTELLT